MEHENQHRQDWNDANKFFQHTNILHILTHKEMIQSIPLVSGFPSQAIYLNILKIFQYQPH